MWVSRPSHVSSKWRDIPEFPVKFYGVDKLHAAFLNESRTRGRCLVPRTGNPGVWFSLGETPTAPVYAHCETAYRLTVL
jgi:hypothetical protein